MILAEPYRLFFPLGILAGLWGVLMWPLFYGGHLEFYPNEVHARLMVCGFMGAFAAGFLGTAFPRLTGGRHWHVGELAGLLLLWLLMVAAWSRGMVKLGEQAFALMMLVLMAGLAWRALRHRRDTPPPGFVLAFAGLGGAALAAAWLAHGPPGSLEWWRFARLCLLQGFLLLPLMGIAPFLLPRFFGEASHHSLEDSAKPPPGWWPKALASAFAGVLVLGSFALEAWGHALAGQISRAAVVLAWFIMETPVLRRTALRTTPGTAVRWAVLSLALGLACAAIWPSARIGSLHLFFVSGLGLVTMAVGARVILGHAGRHDLLGGGSVWLRWVIGLVVLAAATRMSADFIPSVRVSHHIYAAWTWVAAALVWLLALGKYLWREEAREKPASSCPRGKGPGRRARP